MQRRLEGITIAGVDESITPLQLGMLWILKMAEDYVVPAVEVGIEG